MPLFAHRRLLRLGAVAATAAVGLACTAGTTFAKSPTSPPATTTTTTPTTTTSPPTTITSAPPTTATSTTATATTATATATTTMTPTPPPSTTVTPPTTTAAPATPAMVGVDQGVNPTAISGATETGAASPSQIIDVSFILKAQNLAALEAKVVAGWTGPYLTPVQFAAQYGSPRVGQLESYLKGFGITSTADTDDLDVTSSGTVAEYQQALGLKVDDYTIPGQGSTPAQAVYASATEPQLPAGLGAAIVSILGLSNYQMFTSHTASATDSLAQERSTPTQPIPLGDRTPADFERDYHLSSLEDQGDLGQGQTVGIITTATVDPGAPQTFWQDLGLTTKANRLTYDDIDGGAGAPSSESLATDASIEQAGAVAPQANIMVYQVPADMLGYADGLFAAASQNLAGSVSSDADFANVDYHVGVAEHVYSPEVPEAFNESLLEMAAQGQSDFTSSGDYGAYSGVGAGLPGEPGDLATSPSTSFPSNSPYTTAVGGTTPAGTITYYHHLQTAVTGECQAKIPQEMTWGSTYAWPLDSCEFGYSYLIPTYATTLGNQVGSGGGYSPLVARPGYQQGVPGIANDTTYRSLIPSGNTGGPYNRPDAFNFNFHAHTEVGAAPAGRATPDLAFDADPNTGYAVYDPEFASVPPGAILDQGGTVFPTAQLDGTDAVYESALGHRIGFWNPTIYGAAQSSSSPFTPLDNDQTYSGQSFLQYTDFATDKETAIRGTFVNSNGLYTGTHGAVFNPGSGLGYANLGELEQDFAAH